MCGIAIASILTGIIIYKVLMQIRNHNIQNYNGYLESLQIPPKIKDIFSSVINIFLLMSFYVMIAGFCAYFEQEFGLSFLLVGGIVCTMCYLTFMKRIEGVTKMNLILIPFLIIMIVFIFIKTNPMRKYGVRKYNN